MNDMGGISLHEFTAEEYHRIADIGVLDSIA
jgi:hypothetical protein